MSFSSEMCLLLTILLVLLQSAQVCPQCEPAEEGKPFSIPCPGSRCDKPLLYKWTARGTGEPEKHISHCDTTLDCTGNNTFFTINIAQDGDGYQSTLTIGKVSRTEPFNNEVTWTCQYCGATIPTKTCSLQIFAKPVNPKCQATEILDGSSQLSKINLTCKMESVYPEAKCLFQTVAEDGSLVSPQQIQNSCNNIIDVAVLREGQNVIRATVGSSRQPDFDQIPPIPVSPNIRLWLPKTSIECPNVPYKNGFYKGESVSCQCKLTDPGKPPGRSVWFRNGAEQIGNLSLTSQQNPAELNTTCAGVSVIGSESPGNTFSPKFAFLRPKITNFTTIYEDRPEDSCCGNAGVFAICEIATSEVNPAPRIIFLVDNIEASNTQETYRNTFRFRPKVGGLFKVACRIENAIFSELVENIAVNITIHSPVQLAEPAEVREYYGVKIEPGAQVIFKADVTAYPKPTNFTLYRGTPGQNITVNSYDVQYIESSPSTGTVELTMTTDSPSDLTKYSLVIVNGIGNGLVYSFTLEEDTEDDLRLVYIIVGVVAGVIVIIAITLVVCWRVRRAKHSNEKLGANNKDDKNNENKHDPEDEDTIYHEPKDDEPEADDQYADYVDTDGIPPSVITPKPPKAKSSHGKADKEKGKKKDTKKNSKSEDQSKTSFNDTVDAQEPKNKSNKGEFASGYVNVGHEDTELEVPPPSPTPHTTENEEIYANVHYVAESNDEERDYLNVENSSKVVSSGSGQDNVTEEAYYSSIDDRVMY